MGQTAGKPVARHTRRYRRSHAGSHATPTHLTPPAAHGTHTISITISTQVFDRLAHIAEVQGRAVEEVATDAVVDQLNGEIYRLPYRDRGTWMAGLEGWSLRLAELIRDLADLPRHDATRMIALTHAQIARSMPEQLFERHVEQLTRHWLERVGTRWGRREDGSADPLEDSPVEAMASPEQWDALRRIGSPGSINDAMQAVLAADIAALDT